jgi:hypothetical protein
MLFGGEVDVELWLVRVRRQLAMRTDWVYDPEESEPAEVAPEDTPGNAVERAVEKAVEGVTGSETGNEADEKPAGTPAEVFAAVNAIVLPIASRRGDTVAPFSNRSRLRKGDVVTTLVFSEREEEARAGLAAQGFAPAPDPV